jgi:hypothetical protein
MPRTSWHTLRVGSATSIAPLLFLYCFSIVPLLLRRFSPPPGTWLAPMVWVAGVWVSSLLWFLVHLRDVCPTPATHTVAPRHFPRGAGAALFPRPQARTAPEPGQPITILACAEISGNVIPFPCEAANLGLKICSGTANPENESGGAGTRRGRVLAGICVGINNLELCLPYSRSARIVCR